jgi:hypothetical protein
MRHGLRLRVLIPLLLAVVGAAAGLSLGLSGEAAAAGRDSSATRFVALAVSGSATVSGHSVALTYRVSNVGELPVIGITLSGAIYQGLDTTQPSGSRVTTFDCALSDDAGSPPLIPLSLLVLAPDTSVTCFATLELAPGLYTAWLSACGLFLGDVPPARGAVPFVLPAPPSASPPPTPKPSPSPPPVTPSHSHPASPSPNPSVPRTAPRLATSAAPRLAVPPSSAPPASVRPHSNSSPPASPTPNPTSLAIIAALAQPVLSPAATEDPTQPFILLVILPAAVAAAAALSRRR